jgi:hypothetical protein
LRNVFNILMDDAIMTPLFNYNYRISAPPGVNGLRLTPGAGLISPAPGYRHRRRDEAGRRAHQALPYRFHFDCQELP